MITSNSHPGCKQNVRVSSLLTYALFYAVPFILFLCISCKRDISPMTQAPTSSVDMVMGTPAKPNIILILSDDVGFEVPTINGGQSYSTPNIDALALGGVRFAQCHATPLCSPSRFMLLTGKYNFRNYTTWGHMDTKERTIGNMLKNAGYATCYTGKWQLDGGDSSAHIFGWDHYSFWLPFKLEQEYLAGSRYKSPTIYQDGDYLDSAITYNQYGDDMFTSYLLRFADSAHKLNKPFFCYYSMDMCHGPITPSPDHPDYATYPSFTRGDGDPKYFPSMIAYTDKKIGQIIDHLRDSGMLENTIIIYTGDNGTNRRVKSRFRGFTVPGGKKQTTEPGTNVPLIVYWPGHTYSGVVSTTMIDFTDFLPTLADVAGISKPSDYGELDGVSFYPAINSSSDFSVKTAVYSSFSIEPMEHPFNRWAQTNRYKLYDTTRRGAGSGMFVKIAPGKPDSEPLDTLTLTPKEKAIKQNLFDLLRNYH
ncbi:MAG: sulfatase-like hydrolase/transferase [Panacibacter sp.]